MVSLRAKYESRVPALERLSVALEDVLRASLKRNSHVDRIGFRAKGVQSFQTKAKRDEYSTPLVEIEDQVAGRVLVFFSRDIDAIREVAASLWVPVEESHHKPARDAEFGYESFHQIFAIPEHLKPSGWEREADMPVTFELQIRTLFMHAYAEPQHDFGYKEASQLKARLRRQLAWIAASAWGADQAYEDVLRVIAEAQ